MSDDTFDPDALSEAEWSPIGRALSDVTVPAAARESAVAAALAVFDELQASGELRATDSIAATAIVDDMTSADTVSDTVSSASKSADVVRLEDRRRRRYRMLSRVAAAVAVLFIGGVAARGLGRSDNGTAFEAASKTATNVSEVAGTEAASGQAATAQSDAAEPNVAAVSGEQPEAGAMTATTFAMATTLPSDAGTLDQKTSPTATIGSLNGPAIVDSATVLLAVESPEALLAYANGIDSAGEPARSAVATACNTATGTLVGTVLYQGRTATVFLLPNGSVTALDESTCTTLVTVSP